MSAEAVGQGQRDAAEAVYAKCLKALEGQEVGLKTAAAEAALVEEKKEDAAAAAAANPAQKKYQQWKKAISFLCMHYARFRHLEIGVQQPALPA